MHGGAGSDSRFWRSGQAKEKSTLVLPASLAASAGGSAAPRGTLSVRVEASNIVPSAHLGWPEFLKQLRQVAEVGEVGTAGQHQGLGETLLVE